MILYQTPDMEAAIRLMAQRNHYATIFVDYNCKRRIRLRANKIADLPMKVVRPWDTFANMRMDAWRNKGGLLHYSYSHAYPAPVMTDAMLFVEAPLQYDAFVKHTSRVVNEVIVYRPPTWELHTETINRLYPTSETHSAIDLVIDGLMGRELTPVSGAALMLSGAHASYTAVFTADDIAALTGMDEAQLRTVLRHRRFFGLSHRYHPYRLNIRPDAMDLAWAYDVLEAEPDVYRGLRMLRTDRPLGPHQEGFNKLLKELCRQKYVTREPRIYVVTQGFAPLNPSVADASSNARRGDWYKMMTAIDAAKEYV